MVCRRAILGLALISIVVIYDTRRDARRSAPCVVSIITSILPIVVASVGTFAVGVLVVYPLMPVWGVALDHASCRLHW